MPEFRADLLSRLHGALAPGADLAGLVAPGCDWQVSRPVAPATGPEGVEALWLAPLRAALTGLHRRDALFLGGENRRGEGRWCAGLCHYVGNQTGELWGVPASGRLAMLRAGEFYGLDDAGRVRTARIVVDLPDLMIQGGRNPFGGSLGTELAFPPPATLDGVLPDPAGGAASLDAVERMLGDLHAYDPETGGSRGQTGAGGAWADDMIWWGPAGIGSNHRWEGFVKDHRAPFLAAFPDRKGGSHYCRVGDGAYAAVSGWPSMTMTWRADYLGHGPADGRALRLRVMDFYRLHRAGPQSGRIAENWVLLDYVDLFEQMGRDLLAP